jgi:hypothetical protein
VGATEFGRYVPRFQGNLPPPSSQLKLFRVRARVTWRLAVCRQSVHLGSKYLEISAIKFFPLNPCGIRPYVTSTLTRGWVCRLQLLLVFASAVILGSESRELVTIFCCFSFDTPQTWRVRFPYLYSPGTGFPFHRLLRLSGLRWRYSNPSPRGL